MDTMREAALRARHLHARAELMRHMRLTARKVKDRPLEEAVQFRLGRVDAGVGLDGDAYRDVAAPLRAYTEAFCRDAHAPGAASNAANRGHNGRAGNRLRARRHPRWPTRWRSAPNAHTAGGRPSCQCRRAAAGAREGAALGAGQGILGRRLRAGLRTG